MYNQNEVVKVVSNLLINQGFYVAISSRINPKYHILAVANGKVAKKLVRHLQ